MEGITKRFRNISEIESAAISAITECVNPVEIFADLHTCFLIEEDFNAKKCGPEYERVVRTLREGCEFVIELAAPDWGGGNSLQAPPPYTMGPYCDRVRQEHPGEIAPFLERMFVNDPGLNLGLAKLIVSLAKLHDKLPKYKGSNESLDHRYQALMAIWDAVATGIAKAEKALDEFLKPPFDYHAYLRSPEWKAKRDAQVEAAGGRCQVCNSTKQLNCHHRTYERIGNELPDDLFVLRAECHQIFHENGRLARL